MLYLYVTFICYIARKTLPAGKKMCYNFLKEVQYGIREA